MFLALTFLLGGLVQTIWLHSRTARAWAIPIDAGICLRGRRLFGDNKTWRGFVVMIPASGCSCLLMSLVWDVVDAAPWPLSSGEYFLIGCLGGLGFMAGELPNSLIKRQLDIPAGAAAANRFSKLFFFLVDQVDSTIGGLAAVSLVISLPVTVCLLLILIGGILHLAVNVVLWRLRLRNRFA